MVGLMRELPDLDPTVAPVTKGSDVKILEQILSQMMAMNLTLNKICHSLESMSQSKFESAAQPLSMPGPRLQTGYEEDDLVCLDNLARTGKGNRYYVDDEEEEVASTSTYVERSQFHAMKYKNRDELFSCFIMSVYHTLLETDGLFDDISQKPDFISFHARSMAIVRETSKVLGNGTTIIPEIKETSMATLARFLNRREKGEVFLLMPDIMSKIRTGAKTGSLFGTCESVMMALAKMPELFPYPLSCVVGAVKSPIVTKKDGVLGYNFDKSLCLKLMEKFRVVSPKDHLVVKHAMLPVYVKMRITTTFSVRKCKDLVASKSIAEIEEVIHSKRSDAPPKRKSAPASSSTFIFAA